MKNLTSVVAAMMTGVLASFASAANIVDPSAFSMKFYEARISPRADCGGGFVRIFQDSSPSYQDMLAGPTLGTGSVPNGTYRCVALKASDVIRYTPSVTTSGGNCIGGTPYSKNIARGEVTTGPDGDSITTVDGEDPVWLYLSTGGVDTNTCFEPSQACRLSAPMVINAQGGGLFVTDARNGIEDLGPGDCSLENVQFSFR